MAPARRQLRRAVPEAREHLSGFSVVISTRNRARLVRRAIESVLAQEYPSAGYELIVIDNGSADSTGELVRRSLARAAIPASYYREERVGVSFARNRGASLARFEYVAFLDDDAEAEPQWLATFAAAIAAHGAVALGGRVEPVVEEGVEAPYWWDDADIRGLFGLDHSEALGCRSVSRIRWPLWLGGGNAVYSRRLLGEFAFRTDMGPVGRRRRVAEDIDLNIRLERAGVPLYYAHDAVIRHVVTADRLTARFIRRRAYWAGRTDAAARALLGEGADRGSFRGWTRAALRTLAMPEPPRTMSSFRLAYSAGYLLGSRTPW